MFIQNMDRGLQIKDCDCGLRWLFKMFALQIPGGQAEFVTYLPGHVK